MGNTVAGSDSIALDLLLEMVYRQGGRDFREYKRSTIIRRLERRLHAVGAKTYFDYMQFLDAHPDEYLRLTDTLTIKVSGFFRSPYTFQQVATLVLPELVSHKRSRGGHSLRFWSAACARGEEPYSIAMLLTDSLGDGRPDFDIAIYATDISRQTLEEAQAGAYSQKDIANLPRPILDSYFTHCGESFMVRTDVRQMVSFSYFDLVSTTKPPFLNLDCIFCCNILIYLQKSIHERVLNMLYDSLATPGYLILGEAETPPGSLRDKLECLDGKAKIYKKNKGGNNV
jgi:two-component system CheB/CheR fusion protein